MTWGEEQRDGPSPVNRPLIAQVFAREWPRLVATLVRDLGDLALAEDCAQEAFAEATGRWGPDSTPDRPGAWLLVTARRKAVDRIRRDRRFADRLGALEQAVDTPPAEPTGLIDDQLALIFGCCHPSLDIDAQVALTLREVCGLSTTQIAVAFLVAEPTMAKRLVRAKDKIRTAGVPFTFPAPDRLGDRLAAVLGVVYLIFTEGHTSTTAATLVRGDLCDEARWLGSVLVQLLPDEPEVLGLDALMGLVDARRDTRIGGDGELVLMEDQDRARWDHAGVDAAMATLRQALAARRVGPYQLQAAIAGAHMTAPSPTETDWRAVVGLYDVLLMIEPRAVVALNRAVAVAMVDGPGAGLALIEDLAVDGELSDFRYLHAARADLLRRLARPDEAAEAYGRALALTDNATERSFLTRRLAEVER